VDIGPGLTGKLAFSERAYYLGTGLVFLVARKYACCRGGQPNRLSETTCSLTTCASGTNPCWAKATTRPSVRSTGRSSWIWSDGRDGWSRTELARRSKLTKPTVLDHHRRVHRRRDRCARVGLGESLSGGGTAGAAAGVQRRLGRLLASISVRATRSPVADLAV